MKVSGKPFPSKEKPPTVLALYSFDSRLGPTPSDPIVIDLRIPVGLAWNIKSP
jgi:hypothetical protein